MNYNLTIKVINLSRNWGLGIGDWGLGPIPNPQCTNKRSVNIKTLKTKKN